MKKFQRKGKVIASLLMTVLCVLIFGVVSVSAVSLGDELSAPEQGWQRVNNSDSRITYQNWNYYVDTTSGVDMHYNSTTALGTISFNFTGTDLRLIYCCNGGTIQNTISIDEQTAVTIPYMPGSTSPKDYLTYEITGLANTSHSVLITRPLNTTIWTSQFSGYDYRTSTSATPMSTPTPIPIQDTIVPHLNTDKAKYIKSDIVPLALTLTNTVPTDKTNSVTFEVEYDPVAFSLASDVNTAVVNGYIPFDTKMDLGTTNKRVLMTYLTQTGDTNLQEAAKVATINFKVKDDAPLGVKTFTLRPVNMLDSNEKVYNINNGNVVTKTVEITNDAVVEGFVKLYLGDAGTGLKSDIFAALNQEKIDETLRNLKFTLKHDANDTGTVLTGADVFIPDENGILGTKYNGNKTVIAKYRIYTQDTANTLLKISDVGYLAKDFSITLNSAAVSTLSTLAEPTEMYPGDLGQVINLALVMTPDGKVNNIDFNAWLKIYKLNQTGTAALEDIRRADFSKDGVIDNTDFSLWLASYKKLLTE